MNLPVQTQDTETVPPAQRRAVYKRQQEAHVQASESACTSGVLANDLSKAQLSYPGIQ